MTTKKAGRIAADRTAPVYQLRITLLEVKPLVWRRLRVRGDINLGLLHCAFQLAMGWTNSHLHQFEIARKRYVDPSCEPDDDFGGPPLFDEHPVLLRDVATSVRARFRYVYDFGDDWTHEVTVEEIAAPDPTMRHFVECIDGQRACPPEDCGGAYGYAEFLEAIADPKHEEHESMLEWAGGLFNPEAFDLNRTNTCLRKLKWPRMSIEQLARVLMQRDAHRGWIPRP